MNTIAISLIVLFTLFTGLFIFRDHIECWLYYYKRNRKMKKVCRAMRKTIEALGQLTIATWQAGISFSELDKQMQTFIKVAKEARK